MAMADTRIVKMIPETERAPKPPLLSTGILDRLTEQHDSVNRF